MSLKELSQALKQAKTLKEKSDLIFKNSNKLKNK